MTLVPAGVAAASGQPALTPYQAVVSAFVGPSSPAPAEVLARGTQAAWDALESGDAQGAQAALDALKNDASVISDPALASAVEALEAALIDAGLPDPRDPAPSGGSGVGGPQDGSPSENAGTGVGGGTGQGKGQGTENGQGGSGGTADTDGTTDSPAKNSGGGPSADPSAPDAPDKPVKPAKPAKPDQAESPNLNPPKTPAGQAKRTAPPKGNGSAR
jgi:hypothetical protein